MKILVQSQVHAPVSGSPQHVPLCHTCLSKNVRSHGRHSEGCRIPDLVTILLIDVIAKHHWTERWFSIEVPDSVQRSNTDIAGLYGTAVIAGPERRKTCSGFCEHIKGSLPSAYDRIRPAGHRGAVRATASDGQVVDAISNQAMA